jgi:hypothetical protein
MRPAGEVRFALVASLAWFVWRVLTSIVRASTECWVAAPATFLTTPKATDLQRRLVRPAPRPHSGTRGGRELRQGLDGGLLGEHPLPLGLEYLT